MVGSLDRLVGWKPKLGRLPVVGRSVGKLVGSDQGGWVRGWVSEWKITPIALVASFVRPYVSPWSTRFGLGVKL